ncbi:response regulator transcription factor [Streptomyces sp. NBC_00568]|uniref:response regulator transcription factor n=1 Tax=Streptomyces sp. NBC_00568 TaxID=2975779 RepID=UPI00224D2076|nr:response regulator transcription factor [Streptomyces sp. NBC_00568]MCX4993617.1 response regulator transcription factor [Streptomyces sp. NBC_00568]
MCARVLIAEDDKKQAELIRQYLEHAGHHTAVVHDGYSALDLVRQDPPDLLILDVMLPRLDGLQVCRILRRETDLPVLMLTARSTEDDLLHGLDLGADDYMTKPYSPRELMARIRTLLRRSDPAAAPGPRILRAGALTVDPVRHEVLLSGQLVVCTPGEFALLTILASQPGRVFTRQQLLELTRGSDQFIGGRIVDVHIGNLRRKIERNPRRPVLLVTVFGVGYKLEGTQRHRLQDGNHVT